MCGIAGILDLEKNISLSQTIEWMKEAIKHRGPDEAGTFIDESIGIALGHQRLTILDSQGGKQPFVSADGQLILVFNGEIYNYLELRSELIKENYPICTRSDTEVIIYAYANWGIECLQHLRGMFSLVLWNRKSKTLFCARDRLGIKPFYYYFNKQQFIFASEIKAILASKCVKAAMNKEGLSDYQTFQFCLGEETLFQNIKKLEPGYYFFLEIEEEKFTLKKEKYWDVSIASHNFFHEQYYIEKLINLLKESVILHLQSDVPIGAYLSGGLDSSAITCLASKAFKEKDYFKTFTGIFSAGPEYDESAYAREVAHYAGCEHHEIFISSIDLSSTLPKLIYFMDEPAAGPGLIPQYYVSQFAAKQVKVVLGGQGGDELYIGYARYLIAYLEKCLSGAISGKPGGAYSLLAAIAPHLSTLGMYKKMLNNAFKSGIFRSDDELYFDLVNRNDTEYTIFLPETLEKESKFNKFQSIFNKSKTRSLIDKMLYFDLKASLPALLQVEDRMSMAVSLESRLPLLDHKLVEFSVSIPEIIKFSSGKTKHVFREAVKNFIPPAISARKDKMGFPVPLLHWFYTEKNNFLKDVFFSKKSKERGLLDIKQLQKIFKKKAPISRSIWGALCLELWFVQFID